jgi:proline dehydrogenase
MLRRVWQRSMIALALNKQLGQAIQGSRLGHALARRYTAGEDVAAAIRRASDLFAQCGVRASLFYLGEYVSDPAKIALNVTRIDEAIDALATTDIDRHVSVDPTQIGAMTSAELARGHAESLTDALSVVAREKTTLMIDMEDGSFTDSTIALHDTLRAAGKPVALTLQANLRRTEADLLRQIAQGAHVRLVKGAFVSTREKSFVRRDEINMNSRRLIDLMFSQSARERGFYPSIATHDVALQRHAIERAKMAGWQASEWEIEMLLGVRDDLAAALAAEGFCIRLYMPFGVDWWPYAIRRIGENPGNAWLLARSLVSRG